MHLLVLRYPRLQLLDLLLSLSPVGPTLPGRLCGLQPPQHVLVPAQLLHVVQEVPHRFHEAQVHHLGRHKKAVTDEMVWVAPAIPLDLFPAPQPLVVLFQRRGTSRVLLERLLQPASLENEIHVHFVIGLPVSLERVHEWTAQVEHHRAQVEEEPMRGALEQVYPHLSPPLCVVLYGPGNPGEDALPDLPSHAQQAQHELLQALLHDLHALAQSPHGYCHFLLRPHVPLLRDPKQLPYGRLAVAKNVGQRAHLEEGPQEGLVLDAPSGREPIEWEPILAPDASERHLLAAQQKSAQVKGLLKIAQRAHVHHRLAQLFDHRHDDLCQGLFPAEPPRKVDEEPLRDLVAHEGVVKLKHAAVLLLVRLREHPRDGQQKAHVGDDQRVELDEVLLQGVGLLLGVGGICGALVPLGGRGTRRTTNPSEAPARPPPINPPELIQAPLVAAQEITQRGLLPLGPLCESRHENLLS
mmetsp:Transcript_5087/g.15279  ORF Transcript_5087/g.15279 Transcript_5087/m.15279 type:complete len:468 (-) Transcript_5087:310-1713(-)